MRFDHQIKCDSAQELIEQAQLLLISPDNTGISVTQLQSQIGIQVYILTHCASHSDRQDQFAIQQKITELETQKRLLQTLFDKIKKSNN